MKTDLSSSVEKAIKHKKEKIDVTLVYVGFSNNESISEFSNLAKKMGAFFVRDVTIPLDINNVRKSSKIFYKKNLSKELGIDIL